VPKQAKIPNAKEQGERFEKAIRDLIAAGELNPTEAAERFEKLTRRVLPKKTG